MDQRKTSFWKWYLNGIWVNLKGIAKDVLTPIGIGLIITLLSILLPFGFLPVSAWSCLGFFGIPLGITLLAYGYWRESGSGTD